MPERRDQAPQHEEAHRPLRARLGERGGVVDHVLHGREPQTDHGRVDDAVGRAVDLASAAPDQPQERGALERLLDQGGHHHQGRGLRHPLAHVEGPYQHHRAAQFQDDAEDHRDTGAPGEREEQVQPGLGLQPVEREHGGEQDRQRCQPQGERDAEAGRAPVPQDDAHGDQDADPGDRERGDQPPARPRRQNPRPAPLRRGNGRLVYVHRYRSPRGRFLMRSTTVPRTG